MAIATATEAPGQGFVSSVVRERERERDATKRAVFDARNGAWFSPPFKTAGEATAWALPQEYDDNEDE